MSGRLVGSSSFEMLKGGGGGGGGPEEQRMLSPTPFRHKRPRSITQPPGSREGSAGGSRNSSRGLASSSRALLSTAGRNTMLGRLEGSGLGPGGSGTGGGRGARLHAKLLQGGADGEASAIAGDAAMAKGGVSE